MQYTVRRTEFMFNLSQCDNLWLILRVAYKNYMNLKLWDRLFKIPK